MPITVNGFDGAAFDQKSIESMQGRFITCHYRLALSGSYPTGGDTLDFTNGGVNSAVPPGGRVIEGVLIKDNAGSTASFIGQGGIMTAIGTPGTTAPSAWKLKLLAAIGTESSAGAYSGLATGNPLLDTIEMEVTWAR